MFGNIGQIAGLLKNAGKIQENMKRMQERLREARFLGEAGGGQVSVTVDGKGEMVAIKIDPQLITDGDRELLEDLIVAASRSAVALSRDAVAREMHEATGGLDLGGFTDMLKS